MVGAVPVVAEGAETWDGLEDLGKIIALVALRTINWPLARDDEENNEDTPLGMGQGLAILR